MTPAERIRLALERSEASRRSVAPSIQPVSELKIADIDLREDSSREPQPARSPAPGSPGIFRRAYRLCVAGAGMFALGMFGAYVLNQPRSTVSQVLAQSPAPTATVEIGGSPQPAVSAADRQIPPAAVQVPAAALTVRAEPAARTFTPPPPSLKTVARQATTDLLDPGAPTKFAATPVNPLPALNAIPEPPARPISTPTPATRIGGMFQAPVLIRTIRPQYPSMARTARVEGAVRFTATVGRDGTVRRLDLLNGPEMLVDAAREACMQWVYRPAILDGAPIETTTIIEVRFTLNH